MAILGVALLGALVAGGPHGCCVENERPPFTLNYWFTTNPTPGWEYHIYAELWHTMREGPLAYKQPRDEGSEERLKPLRADLNAVFNTTSPDRDRRLFEGQLRAVLLNHGYDAEIVRLSDRRRTGGWRRPTGESQ